MLLLVRNYTPNIKGLAHFNSVAPPVSLNGIIHLLLFLERHVIPGRRKKCILINWCLSLEVITHLNKVLCLLSLFKEGGSCSYIQVSGAKTNCPSLWNSKENNKQANMNHTPLINHYLVVEGLFPKHCKAILILNFVLNRHILVVYLIDT